MPKIYTRTQKNHALWVVTEVGDVATAAKILDMPSRTLRGWYRQYRNSYDIDRPRPHRDPNRDYLTPPTDDADAPTLPQLRDNLLKQINTITKAPTDDPRQAYYAALAVRALLEQVRQLNQIIGLPTHAPKTD